MKVSSDRNAFIILIILAPLNLHFSYGNSTIILNKKITFSYEMVSNKELISFEYLFNVSLGLIDYYEKLFDVAFPLPKLDHVTVPDFNFSAMENFGLIIYK